MHHYDNGDHLHATALEDQRTIRTESFDYDEVDRQLGHEPEEDTAVSMADAAACFSLILEWCLKAETLVLVGSRCASLAIYLDPINNSKFGSNLAEIAETAGCTRAALSKALLGFRDASGIQLSAGKVSGSRPTYRASQVKAIEAGRHSSTTRRDLKRKRTAVSS
jgi:hypothetical protein